MERNEHVKAMRDKHLQKMDEALQVASSVKGKKRERALHSLKRMHDELKEFTRYTSEACQE